MQGRLPTSLFPLLVLGLLAALTWWLEIASRPPAGSNDGRLRHDPDYIVEDFEVRRYGPQGALQHTLRAAMMRHYPDDDTTAIVAPSLTYHKQPPITITAREARLDGKGEHLQLIDDVRLIRAGERGKPATMLVTSHLDFFPDEETAASRVPVTITQGQSTVSGSGLQVNNKTATYVLDGPVRGIFHRGQAAYAPTRGSIGAAPTAAAKPRPPAKARKRTSR